MEDVECFTSTEREENVREIRDEIEALKAIYNNNEEEEEEEVKEEEERIKKDLFNKKLISSKRIIGLFDDDGIVRSDQKPTHQEMIKMAVNFLSSNTKACSGFFLMSEGSQIDWYGHSNDVTKMIIEFEDFDETIRDTMNFVSEDEDLSLIHI